MVVILYLVREMTHSARSDAGPRAAMRKRGIDLYLIADVVFWCARPNRAIGRCSRSIFRRSRATTCIISRSFSTGYRMQYQASDRVAREHGLKFVPTVMPGYDDTRLRGKDRETLAPQDGASTASSGRCQPRLT